MLRGPVTNEGAPGGPLPLARIIPKLFSANIALIALYLHLLILGLQLRYQVIPSAPEKFKSIISVLDRFTRNLCLSVG